MPKSRSPTPHSKLPGEVSDAQAILLSDIFPTAHFGADIAGIKLGHTAAVFGCGPHVRRGRCAVPPGHDAGAMEKNNPAGYNPQGSDWILGD